MKSSSISRIPIYRFTTIHKQISLGILPNAKTLASQLEVSQKTIQRDIEAMRNQYGFPIIYDKVHKGFFYDNLCSKNFSVLYWQSIFNKMKKNLEDKTPSSSNLHYCTFLEKDLEKRKILEKLTSTIVVCGFLYLKYKSHKIEVSPICLFKQGGIWKCILSCEYFLEPIVLVVDSSSYKAEKNTLFSNENNTSFLNVNANKSEICPFKNKEFSEETKACLCSKSGSFRICTNPKVSKINFS